MMRKSKSEGVLNSGQQDRVDTNYVSARRSPGVNGVDCAPGATEQARGQIVVKILVFLSSKWAEDFQVII